MRGMQGMEMEMQGIGVGMRGIGLRMWGIGVGVREMRVGMRGIRVVMLEIGVEMQGIVAIVGMRGMHSLPVGLNFLTFYPRQPQQCLIFFTPQ